MNNCTAEVSRYIRETIILNERHIEILLLNGRVEEAFRAACISHHIILKDNAMLVIYDHYWILRLQIFHTAECLGAGEHLVSVHFHVALSVIEIAIWPFQIHIFKSIAFYSYQPIIFP